MKSPFPFHIFQPTFCSGLLDDPILFIRIKPQNAGVMVDCGQNSHLAKRVLKSIDAVFITHAHMDHFIGMDSFIRSVLVSNRTIRIYGPESIAQRLHSKIKAYSWNLVENFFCNFEVSEITKNSIRCYCLDGSKKFELSEMQSIDRKNRTIFENVYYKVEAAVCDHKIPVLIYKFTEKPPFQVDEEKIRSNGLRSGPWLAKLKHWFYHRETEEALAQEIETNDRGFRIYNEPETLYESIRKDGETPSIGYVSDMGFTRSNVDAICDLMDKVSFLVCECAFLKKHQQKARHSFHLCTSDLNMILSKTRPGFLLPMHLSKTYLGNSDALYREITLPSGTKLIKLPERINQTPLLPKDIVLDFEK